VFDNRVLRGIFGPKRDEATGGRRKLQNKERRMRWARHVARMEEKRIGFRLLVR
jgi:hypothetical protein